jgi:type II secretory pathway pseudopilin PulG
MMKKCLTIRGWLRKEARGSALLVTLLIMGVLMTLTLGLSTLVIKEIRQTGDIVTAGRAYYAAEAGIEQALYELGQGLPGYETEGFDGWVNNDDDGFEYRYKIENRADSMPYIPDDEPIFLNTGGAVSKETLKDMYPEKTYNVLPLNQSVTIPLFVDVGGGEYKDVEDFLLEYYVDFNVEALGVLPWFNSNKNIVENFDVLRWKLFGNPKIADPNDPVKTEAISDFYPALVNGNPNNPICIGTDQNIETDNSVSCSLPATIVGHNQFWSYARECYLSDAGLMVTAGQDIGTKCDIKRFMDNHKRNYLTITNIVNPEIIGITNPKLRNERANIYWRVIATGATGNASPLSRQLTTIKADGFANGGRVKQSIDVKVAASSFLPVFNFSLYRTDTGQ